MWTWEFMRTEVWHALAVHFPIALLPVSTITFLVSIFLKDDISRYWKVAGVFLLVAGCVMAWVSVYTGNEADGHVARKICDPTVLKDHEIAGKTTTFLFTAALAAMFLALSSRVDLNLRKIFFYLGFALMLAGTGYLVYAGHLGAALVYRQGAGVENHVVDCGD